MSHAPNSAPKLNTRRKLDLERLEAREVPAIGLTQTVNWVEQGPNVISNGQAVNLSSVNPNGGAAVTNAVAGAVQALAPHPTNPNIMFAGGVNGGVWRTDNALAASPIWTPISDTVASLSIADIAIDPANPNRVLACIGGTADGDETVAGRAQGELIGVIYSENALSANPTWTLLGNNLANKNVVKVAIRADYMLVATDAGLYRSTNKGLTFSNVVSATRNNGVSYNPAEVFSARVFDLAQNPRLRNQFYFANGGADPQVWRTDDGGLTWGTVTDNQGQMQLNAARTVAVKITVRDAGIADNQVYVAVSNNFPPQAPGFVVGRSFEPDTVGAQYGWINREGNLTSVTWSTNQGGNWTRMDAPREVTSPEDFSASNNTATGLVTIVIDGFEHRLKTGDLVFLENLIEVVNPGNPGAAPPVPPVFSNRSGFYFITETARADVFTVNGLSVTAADGLLQNFPVNYPLAGPPFTNTLSVPIVVGPGETSNMRRVVGANPGEKTQFLDIVADPNSQNTVYLGGDEKVFKFGADTADSFTGNYWRGDRFEDPSDSGLSFSSQWNSMTDAGTGTDTAPPADTREMVFDSAGNMWVATGGGIYRRSSPTTGNGNWVSANGNIRVGEFWSVSYDSLSQRLVGATQDTGQVVQSATGSLGWNAITTSGTRNLLYDQESAYRTLVDNTTLAAQNQSVRYTYGSSDFRLIQRQVFDANGNLVSSNSLNFAGPLSTSTPRSGLTILDDPTQIIGVPNRADPNSTLTMALNGNDPRRGVYGFTSVYEDSDPLGGPNVGNTITGAIINNVTPFGMTGLVTTMSYGGKRAGLNFNQILYIGTSTGQVWIRGEFGTNFTLVTPAGSSGPVDEIAVNPDNYRNVFVLKGNRVYESKDISLDVAGSSFEDISANLSTTADPVTGLPSVGGLTTQVRSIALWDPNVGTDLGGVTVVAGGRGGVFRRAFTTCGNSNWSELGNNLPNSVVQDLTFSGNTLYAGTFGRGVWAVADVSPILGNTVFLDISGTAGADFITVRADANDPSKVIVSDGVLTQTFVFGEFDAIRIAGFGGADTIFVDSNGAAVGGTLKFVRFPIYADAGGDVGDTLTLNASADPLASTATLTPNTIGYNPGTDSFFGGCGYMVYAGLQQGQINITSGSGNDTFHIFGSPNAYPPVVALNGGIGVNQFNFDSTTKGFFGVSNSEGSGNIFLQGTTGDDSFLATNVSIQTRDLGVQYTNTIQTVAVRGFGGFDTMTRFGTAGNDLLVASQSSIPLRTNVDDGATATLQFQDISSLVLNALGGSDVVVVDSNGLAAGGTTQFVNYAVTANLGGDVNDILSVGSEAATAAIHATISGNSIGYNPGVDNLFATGGYVAHSGLNQGFLSLRTGSGADVYEVIATGGTLPKYTSLDGAAGDDSFAADAAASGEVAIIAFSGNDELRVVGTGGNDSFTAEGTTLLANALKLTYAAPQLESVRIEGNGGTDALDYIGTALGDTILLKQDDLNAAFGELANGVTPPVRFQNVETVAVNSLAGADQLLVDSNGLAAGGNTKFVTYPVQANLGGDAGDSLIVNSVGETANINATVTGASVGYNPGTDTLFGTGGYVGYTGLSQGNLYLNTGSGNDTILTLSGPTLPLASFYNAEAGDDLYLFDGGAAGIVNVTDTSGIDTIQVNVPPGITATFAPFQIVSGLLTINYDSTIENIFFNGGGGTSGLIWNGSNATDNIFLMVDPTDPSGSQILSAGVATKFKGLGTVTINALGGADSLRIDSNGFPGGGTTGFVNYAVIANMGGETGDNIRVNNESSAANTNATIATGSLGYNPGNDTLFGTGGYLQWTGLATGFLAVQSGSGNNSTTAITGTQLPLDTFFFGGPGNDFYQFDAAMKGTVGVNDLGGVTNEIRILGSAGADAFNASGASVTVNALAVNANSSTTFFRIRGNNSADSLTWTGTAGADNVVISGDPTVPNSANLFAGANPSFRFDGLGTEVVNTLGGADNVTVTTSGAAGSDLTFLNSALVANLGGDAGDFLTVNGDTANANTFATTTGTSVGYNPGTDTLFGAGGYVGYTGLSKGSLQVRTGNGNDTQLALSGTPIPAIVYLNGGGGTDEFDLDAAIAGTISVDDTGGADTVRALGSANTDIFNITPGVLTANATLTALYSGNIDTVRTSGNGGYDYLQVGGVTGAANMVLNQTAAFDGIVTTGTVAVQYDSTEDLFLNASGGTGGLTWRDSTGGAYGTPTDPNAGIVYKPTGATSGELRTGGGFALTTLRFANLAGTFTANGSPTSTTGRDVITVLGVSSKAATAPNGELTATSGIDTISALDTGVSITNATLGALKPIAFGSDSSGNTAFSTVFVRSGNETGSTGDTVNTATTNRTNLVLDGGNPTTSPGDTINVSTLGRATSTQVNDPAFGPPQTRVRDIAGGASLGYFNFETVSITDSTAAGPGVPSVGRPRPTLFAAATDVGVPVQLRVFDLAGNLKFGPYTPYGDFSGGATVATGDIDADGINDFIIAAGPGGGPHVRAFSGVTGNQIRSFFAFDASNTAGVNVSLGYVNSDNYADIIVGSGIGAPSQVKVFDGRTGAVIKDFSPFGAAFIGGTTVAAGDFNGDGLYDIVAGTQSGTDLVKIFNGVNNADLAQVNALGGFGGGVNVTAGDINGDSLAELIVGAGPGGTTRVVAYDLKGGTNLIRDFIVNDPAVPGSGPIPVTGGVRVAVADIDNDGFNEILTGRGVGSRPFAQYFRVTRLVGGAVTSVFETSLAVNTFGDDYSNGIFVG